MILTGPERAICNGSLNDWPASASGFLDNNFKLLFRGSFSIFLSPRRHDQALHRTDSCHHPLHLISTPGRCVDALCPFIIQALAPATHARPHHINPRLAKLA